MFVNKSAMNLEITGDVAEVDDTEKLSSWMKKISNCVKPFLIDFFLVHFSRDSKK